MASYANDYQTGVENEKIVYDLLKKAKIFKKLKQSEDRYCKYDFYNKKYEIELKTRNNRYHVYPTTLMPVSKAQREKKHKKTIIFMFKFEAQTKDLKKDIYYIKYDEDVFKKFKIISFKRKSRIGKIDCYDEYYEIPIKKLTCFYELELFGCN
jgi:hypothetical protein